MVEVAGRAPGRVGKLGSVSTAYDPRGAEVGPTVIQWVCLGGGLGGYMLALGVSQTATLCVSHLLFGGLFALSAFWKLIAAVVGRAPPTPPDLPSDALQSYTVIAALYREGAVVSALVEALTALDYPIDRLQILLVLEADDGETPAALARLSLPSHMQVIVKPPGGPKTKPNALNTALRRATGRFVVVYDAEDRPHPGQLREAATRFAREGDLAYLQAPLRIANGADNRLTRQFALEYAGQFEVILPALSRLGATFPLGGTSNHFRTSALRAVGGWDPYNVTEDADMSFRMTDRGFRAGVIARPTFEDAPRSLEHWLPQRTRWTKGYMQTWGVHMRHPLSGGWRKFLALQLSLGLAILGAAFHGPFVLLMGAWALLSLCSGQGPSPSPADAALLVGAWGAAICAKLIGARKAGTPMRLGDALILPLYWPLQSLAFLFAVEQLINRPFHWDKTEHVASAAELAPKGLRGLDAQAA